MIGDEKKSVNGLYLLAARDIFQKLKEPEYQGFKVYVAFFEIYCAKLYDLLNSRKVLFAREDAKKNVISSIQRGSLILTLVLGEHYWLDQVRDYRR
jgi:hypothetical protein